MHTYIKFKHRVQSVQLFFLLFNGLGISDLWLIVSSEVERSSKQYSGLEANLCPPFPEAQCLDAARPDGNEIKPTYSFVQGNCRLPAMSCLKGFLYLVIEVKEKDGPQSTKVMGLNNHSPIFHLLQSLRWDAF